MSYGAFVHAAKQERTDRVNARQQEVDRAKQIVLEHLPDLPGNTGGYVDGWAVRAVLRLNRAGQRLTPTAIKAERNRIIPAAQKSDLRHT